MPPRTTEESYRLPVSDRTMVGTLATACLPVSGTEGHHRGREMKSQEGREPRLFRRGSETGLGPKLGYCSIERPRSSWGAGCHGENLPGTELLKIGADKAKPCQEDWGGYSLDRT